MIMVICIYSEIAHYKVITAVFPWEFTVIFSVRFMLLALVISFRENEKRTLYIYIYIYIHFIFHISYTGTKPYDVEMVTYDIKISV